MSTQNIGSMFGWTSYIVRIGAPCKNALRHNAQGQEPKVVLQGQGIDHWHGMAWWHHGRVFFSMNIWFILKRVLSEQNFQKLKLLSKFLEVEDGLLCPGEMFQMYQQNRKRWQILFPFHPLADLWMGNLQNGMFLPPNINSNQQTSNSFISERRIRLPWGWSFAKRLGWGEIFLPANRQKRDIFSHGWRADWLIFHVNSLSQMAKRLELLGIAYLVGKIQSQLLFHGPKWLSKVSRLAPSWEVIYLLAAGPFEPMILLFP